MILFLRHLLKWKTNNKRNHDSVIHHQITKSIIVIVLVVSVSDVIYITKLSTYTKFESPEHSCQFANRLFFLRRELTEVIRSMPAKVSGQVTNIFFPFLTLITNINIFGFAYVSQQSNIYLIYRFLY